MLCQTSNRYCLGHLYDRSLKQIIRRIELKIGYIFDHSEESDSVDNPKRSQCENCNRENGILELQEVLLLIRTGEYWWVILERNRRSTFVNNELKGVEKKFVAPRVI